MIGGAGVGADPSNSPVCIDTPSAGREDPRALTARAAMGTVVAVIATLALAQPASAATFTVNTTADHVEDKFCDAPPGDCTLRDAVSLAGTNDTINVPKGTYVLNGSLGELSLVADHIVGVDGARDTFIQAEKSRVLLASSGASTVVGGDDPQRQRRRRRVQRRRRRRVRRRRGDADLQQQHDHGQHRDRGRRHRGGRRYRPDRIDGVGQPGEHRAPHTRRRHRRDRRARDDQLDGQREHGGR